MSEMSQDRDVISQQDSDSEGFTELQPAHIETSNCRFDDSPEKL